jgi:hypothetical protein
VTGETAYLLFGGVLCAALVGIIVFYFARRSGSRVERVERAKYEMLKDDDDGK